MWAVINLAIRQSNTKIGCVHLPVPFSWRITLRYRTWKKKNADGKNIQAWLHLCRWHLHLDQIGGDCIRDCEYCSLLRLNVPTRLQSERAQKLINVHVLVLLFLEETFKTGQTDQLEEHFHTTEVRELVYWHFLTSRLNTPPWILITLFGSHQEKSTSPPNDAGFYAPISEAKLD